MLFLFTGLITPPTSLLTLIPSLRSEAGDLNREVALWSGRALPLLFLTEVILVRRKKLFRLLGRLHYSAFAFSQALHVAWMGYWGFFFV